MSEIVLTRDYAWVLLSSVAMAVHIVIVGGGIMKLRRKLNVPYPDMGCGRHASKLSDQDWETFNNCIRSHYNYLEQFGTAQIILLISGLFYPRFAAAMGGLYIVGRQTYASGYQANGPQGRLLGTRIFYPALFSMLGTAIYGIAKTLWV